MTHTEKAADLQGNLYTLFVASVEYNEKQSETWLIRYAIDLCQTQSRCSTSARRLSTDEGGAKISRQAWYHILLSQRKVLMQRQEKLDAWLGVIRCPPWFSAPRCYRSSSMKQIITRRRTSHNASGAQSQIASVPAVLDGIRHRQIIRFDI